MTELQEKTLGLLKEIDQLCRKYDIDYYITGGSLIGALRHKGFIPWDDDADIIMTRSNFEKFLEKTKGELPEHVILNAPCENAELPTTVNHYADIYTAAIFRYHVTNPEKTGYLIDILIMDPVPDDPVAKKEYVSALMKHTELTVLPYQYSLRGGESTHFSWYWCLSRIIGMSATLNIIDKQAFSYDEETSELYAQRYGGAPHFWPKEYYGKPHYVPFEDTMLPIPERAEDCLCLGYDDEWMFVPKSGQLKSTHDFCVRSMTVPARIIDDDFRKMINQRSMMHTYVRKKMIQVNNTDKRLYQETGKDQFAIAKLQMTYERKRKEENFQDYVKEGDYESLALYFKEYIDVQCTSRFLGSSSLTGWMNWYRKCSPLLIDIGDEELYAVLVLFFHQQHLSWIGKLLKARKSIDRPLTEQLDSINQLYNAVKTAKSHFNNMEWKQCQEIVDEFYPKFPHNPYIYRLNVELKLKMGCKFCDVQDELTEGLKLFPEDSELELLEAEYFFEMGDMEQALSLYQKLSEECRDGLILIYMKEKVVQLMSKNPDDMPLCEIWMQIRRQSGEEIEEDREEEVRKKDGKEITESDQEDEDEASEDTEEASGNEVQESTDKETLDVSEDTLFSSNEIQKARYQLLVEVTEICNKYDIKYYLIYKALIQALQSGICTDPNADLSIAIFQEDCERFLEAVEKEGKPDRYIDAMCTNPDFHRFAIRYCNKNTLDMAVSRCDSGDKFGLYVTVEILRSPAQNKYVDLFYRAFEAGWETSARGKRGSFTQGVSKVFVNFLYVLMLGRKRAGKIIFKLLAKGPKRKNTERVFIKSFGGKRKYYPSYYFAYTKEVKLEDHTFTTMKLSDLYLKTQYGENWEEKTTHTVLNPSTRIIAVDIPYTEYLNYLEKHHIDRKAYGKNYRKTDTRYSRIDQYNDKVDKYWDTMCMCGERYRLYEKYMPLKEQIIQFYQEDRVDELQILLEDCTDQMLLYQKEGLNVCFDQEIFDIVCYVLICTQRTKDAKALRKLNKKHPMLPINTSYIESDDYDETSTGSRS